MPYFLLPDNVGDDPRWMQLAEGKHQLVDNLQAAYLRLFSLTAHHMHDGYLTAYDAQKACRGRKKLLELLATPVLGMPPLLHRHGDTCPAKNCIDDSPPWVEGFGFRLCAFSKRNPSRAEKDRNDAQNADSKDQPLRQAVYDRDGGCCRYCRSGPLKKKGMGRAKDRRRALQYDHVDPDRAAGADGANYVVACARCNEEKGHRTPQEADMVLQPVPTDAERVAWAARGEQLFDRPESTVDNDNDNPHDNPVDNAHDNPQTVVPLVVDDSTPAPVPAGEVRAHRGEQPTETTPEAGFEGSGSGRVGHAVVAGSRASPYGTGGQLVRSPDSPDIYHRRSRAPAAEPGPAEPGGDP